MNTSEREQLLERYLAGQMSVAEEEEFFIKVALDRELRGELKAHRAIDGAIRKEVASEPGRHSAIRERMMGMVATYPAPVPSVTVTPTAGWPLWLSLSGVLAAVVVSTLLLLPSGVTEQRESPFSQSVSTPAAVVMAAVPVPPSNLPSALDGRPPVAPGGSTITYRDKGARLHNEVPGGTGRRSPRQSKLSRSAMGDGYVANQRSADRSRQEDDSVPVRIRLQIRDPRSHEQADP